MKIKYFSKKFISALISLSMIASLFVSSGMNVSAESSNEEFNPSWKFTRKYDDVWINGLPNNGIIINLNDDTLTAHPIRIKMSFKVNSAQPLQFGFMKGSIYDSGEVKTESGELIKSYTYKSNNFHLYGGSGSGLYEWESDYIECYGGTYSIPFFKSDVKEADIYSAYRYNYTDDLSSYLSNVYDVDYTITVSDLYGRTIKSYTKGYKSNKEYIAYNGVSSIVTTNPNSKYNAVDGLDIKLNKQTKDFPIYADETGLPNYGIIADLSSVDFSEYPDSKLVFHPLINSTF